jgi:methylated-DNA-[protein]-cysteine S-methyltransferase
MKKVNFYDTEIGTIGIGENNGVITDIFFEGNDQPADRAEMEILETPLIREAWIQLSKYLRGKLKVFNLPLVPKGTAFQKAAWDALLTIPYGETRSYGQMAAQVGNPKACRAIGMANNRNPIAIVIPCHRVIGANGKLVGYGGGLNIKEYLLSLEKQWK